MKTISFLCLLTLVSFPACVGVDFADDEVLSVVAMTTQNSFFQGDIMQLEAKLVNPFGDRFDGPVVWSSSNPAVAEVSESGVLRANALGQVEVRAQHSEVVSNSLFITVVEDTNAVAEIRILGPGSILPLGGMISLSAEARNALGQVIPGLVFEWRSDAPQIAEVSEDGMVTGLTTGATRIFAQAAGISSSGYQLEVAAPSRSGTFTGLNGYQVRGTAFLENSDNGPIVRLGTDFQTSNGPGLYVYLSNSANSVAGGVEVAKLRKNSGEDTYLLPSGVGLTTYSNVIILCKPFSIPFGSATLN
ncbi:MAG: DM13 domain-containing protein [Bacteroidia bacterium]|nr:DM13 domain-containing protein [Bacteroidia bacterium]